MPRQTEARRILLVEDDPRIVRLLSDFFAARGFTLRATFLGTKALLTARSWQPDVILLDRGLPDLPGIEVLRQLQSDPATSDIPVLMLTAQSEEADRVESLLAGADDYVTKPFGLAELDARITAVLRRVGQAALSYRDDELTILLSERRILVQGQPRTLAPAEWDLLGALMHTNQPLSREELTTAIWGKDQARNRRAIDVLISRLRKQIEPNPSRPCYIVTERGVGYRFVRQR